MKTNMIYLPSKVLDYEGDDYYKDNIYVFIAYKPSSSSYSRNCLMANYRSDFIIENMLDEQQLVNKLAEVFYKNENFTGGEEGYEVCILKNGEPDENDAIIDAAKKLCQKRIDDKNMEEIARRKEIERLNAEHIQAEKLKMYEQLKTEFEGK